MDSDSGCGCCCNYRRNSLPSADLLPSKIQRALFTLITRRTAARVAARMETRELSAELAAARSALADGSADSVLDTAIWVNAARAELLRRGALQPSAVRASVPVSCGGALGFAYSPEQALRFAVLTRSRGLGLGLNLSAGTLRSTKELTLGGAEQLFLCTDEIRLVKQEPWDFAEVSNRELDAALADMQEERYYFHKHAIRGTLTPELAADRERMESWGAAARAEYTRRGL